MNSSLIKGVGIDIAKIPRFQKLIKERYFKKFINKALHPVEIEEMNNLKTEEQKAKFLASRWSYKEALVKATGDKHIIFSKTFLKKSPSGKPYICFEEEYRNANENIRSFSENLHMSISHEDDTTIAIVILENDKNKNL